MTSLICARQIAGMGARHDSIFPSSSASPSCSSVSEIELEIVLAILLLLASVRSERAVAAWVPRLSEVCSLPPRLVHRWEHLQSVRPTGECACVRLCAIVSARAKLRTRSHSCQFDRG
jgi:hypothetical protein